MSLIICMKGHMCSALFCIALETLKSRISWFMSEQKGHLLSCTGQLKSMICIALAAQLTCFEDLFYRSNTTGQWEIFQGTLQGKSMRAMALFLTRQKSLDPETMINHLQEWLLLFRLSFSWSSSSSIVIIIADITICSSQQIWKSDEGCKLWPSHHFQFYSSHHPREQVSHIVP